MAVAVAAACLAGCGGGSRAAVGVPGRPAAVEAVAVQPTVPVGQGVTSIGVSVQQPRAISFDVRLVPGAQLDVGLQGGTLRLTGRGGWRHVEATRSRAWVDGRKVRLASGNGQALTFTVTGRVRIRALIITSARDRGSLLLHRIAELHARLPAGVFPVGADLQDRLHNDSSYWTSGFWPGALWEAAALEPAGGMFSRWALAATIAHFGRERTDTHDVGFMYGESSLAAWRALCRGSRLPGGVCARLRGSVVSAADELLSLEASNGRTGTIPTDSRGPQADTIIDSMMNIAILPWASRVTGRAEYARVALRHAREVAALLVRRDGSTAQSVHFDRATGRVLFIHTHQGLSDRSTWARGQAWAVYGFAQAAAELRDRRLLAVAERLAGYVADHLPAGGIPRWDYDAPAGAPVDVSAGVITAAGLMHLASACRSLPGACAGPSGRWTALGWRMLAAALGHASTRPPLGFLGSQVLNERGQGCWCNGGELIFGLTYALEGLRLERGA